MKTAFDLVIFAVISFLSLVLLGLISKIFWLVFAIGWGAL